MKSVIKERPYHSYEWLAWLSVSMIVANVFHTRLFMIFFPFINTGIIMIWFAVSVLLFCLYYYISGKFKIVELRFTIIDWLFLVASVVIFATSQGDTENLQYFIRFFSLFIYVLFMKYDEKMIKIMYICLLVASLIHVAATYFLYYNPDIYLKYVYPTFDVNQRGRLYGWNILGHYATGLAVHFSVNGMYMSIALLLCATLFFDGKKKNRFIYLMLSIICLIALFMTGKRATLVFALFAVVATYLFCAETSTLKKFFTVIAGVLGGAAVIYIAYLNIESIGASFKRFALLFSGNETIDISNGRFKLYGIALDYFKTSPVFGIGWRQFSKRVVVYYKQDTNFRDTHNVFLQLLCETGIVGAVVFFALFAVALIITIYLISEYKKKELVLSDTAKFGLAFSLMTQIYFLCYAMTGNPLYDTITLYYYAFAVGSTTVVYYQYAILPREKRKKEGKFRSKYIRNGNG